MLKGVGRQRVQLGLENLHKLLEPINLLIDVVYFLFGHVRERVQELTRIQNKVVDQRDCFLVRHRLELRVVNLALDGIGNL